jgi:Virulence-associated protein E
MQLPNHTGVDTPRLAVNSSSQLKRFRGDSPCPVCQGSDDDPRGQGRRCHGYKSGNSIFCSREEHAGQAPWSDGASAYKHQAKGPCPCGTEHAPNDKKTKGVFDRAYEYRDIDGTVLHETVRYRDPKRFLQRRPNGQGGFIWSLAGVKTILYCRRELLDADPALPVFVVEGEKDVHRLRALGFVATCNPMGAGKWRPHYSEDLRGRSVVILPDNDPVGHKHAQDVARSLQNMASSVKILELPGLPNEGDVSDFFNSGGTAEKLHQLAEATAGFVPFEHRTLTLVMPPPSNGTQHPVASDEDLPIVNRSGEQTSCLHNSLIWLTRNRYGTSVRFDRFRQAILVDSVPLDDTKVITINAEIEASTRSAWSQEHVRSGLVEIGRRNEFSSLTEWLNSLKWDGVARINRFFHAAYGAEATDYAAVCGKVLFISGVARAYQPGCQSDVMVILIGPQGLGKSMGISSLCPDPSWYADDLGCDLFDRKAGEGLRGKWLIEFSEFSRINRATLDVAKAFVSRRSDYYRAAYGRIHKDYPRTCIFVGTTNDDHPLHDRENRRFMPVRCVKADKDWISANRDQLWAEAVARYRDGEEWWVTVPTLLEEIAQHAEEARQGDSWEEILGEELGHMVVVNMMIAANALKIRPDQLNRSTETRIGLALKALGFERKRARTNGNRAYEWRK